AARPLPPGRRHRRRLAGPHRRLPRVAPPLSASRPSPVWLWASVSSGAGVAGAESGAAGVVGAKSVIEPLSVEGRVRPAVGVLLASSPSRPWLWASLPSGADVAGVESGAADPQLAKSVARGPPLRS